MIERVEGLSYSSKLRHDAEALLRAGMAPLSRGGVIGQDALQLLFRLASSPETSSDALKFLHELQTHQVELDMQQAQLEANEYALERELERYRAVFDNAPVAYAVLDAAGRIIETNRLARALLHISQEGAEEGMLQKYFVPNDADRLTALLTQVRSGQDGVSSRLRLRGGENGERFVRALPAIGAGGEAILMALVPFDNASTKA